MWDHFKNIATGTAKRRGVGHAESLLCAPLNGGTEMPASGRIESPQDREKPWALVFYIQKHSLGGIFARRESRGDPSRPRNISCRRASVCQSLVGQARSVGFSAPSAKSSRGIFTTLCFC